MWLLEVTTLWLLEESYTRIFKYSVEFFFLYFLLFLFSFREGVVLKILVCSFAITYYQLLIFDSYKVSQFLNVSFIIVFATTKNCVTFCSLLLITEQDFDVKYQLNAQIKQLSRWSFLPPLPPPLPTNKWRETIEEKNVTKQINKKLAVSVKMKHF